MVKTGPLLAVTLVLVIIFISGCARINGISKNNDCEEWASKIIPSSVSLVFTQFNHPRLQSLTWLDGQKYSEILINAREYRPGSNTGENINYYYPVHGGFSKNHSYQEMIVDEKGNILGTNSFEVDFILEPVEGTEEFKVIEAKILSCNLVKDMGRSLLDPLVNTPKFEQILEEQGIIEGAKNKDISDLSLKEKYSFINKEMSGERIKGLIGNPDKIEHPPLTSFLRNGSSTESQFTEWFYYGEGGDKMMIQMNLEATTVWGITMFIGREIKTK